METKMSKPSKTYLKIHFIKPNYKHTDFFPEAKKDELEKRRAKIDR